MKKFLLRCSVFVGLKLLEIMKFLGLCVGVFCVLMVAMFILGYCSIKIWILLGVVLNNDSIIKDCIGYGYLTFMISALISLIIYTMWHIPAWIKSNWEKAKRIIK